MSTGRHITVCLCTYRRPELLEKALSQIVRQVTNGLFTYSVVVVDNDERQSALKTVCRVGTSTEVCIDYVVEPRRSIALARNTAMDHAVGDFIAFIDDDEVPEEDWLLRLYEAQDRFSADGVLGVVLPRFEEAPPSWMADRRNNPWSIQRPPTGTRLHEGNTGNALIRIESVHGMGLRFDADYGLTGGEDADFFRRLVDSGLSLVSCRESVVYELVSPERMRPRYLVKRSLLRGVVASRRFRGMKRSAGFRALWLGKAVAAICGYGALLPLQSLWSRASGLKSAMQIAYFAGYLADHVRLDPVKDRRELEG